MFIDELVVSWRDDESLSIFLWIDATPELPGLRESPDDFEKRWPNPGMRQCGGRADVVRLA